MTIDSSNQVPDIEYKQFVIGDLVGKNIGPITIFPPPLPNSLTRPWHVKPAREWVARLKQCYNACEDILDTAQTHARTRENPRAQITHYLLDGLEPQEVREIEDWMRRINVLIQVIDDTGLVRPANTSRPTRR